MLDGGFAVADADADEVINRGRAGPQHPIDRRSFDFNSGCDDVDFLLPNRQSLERVVVFLSFAAQSLGPAWRNV